MVKESSQIASGSTPPSSGSVTNWWYDTANNVIKETTDWNTWSVIKNCSFPICMVTLQLTTPYITSINQVFNGFGYIGSTVFALPGIKGLIPNGRNGDGTLKTREFVTSKVSTIQVLTGATAFGIKGETGDYIVGIFGDDVYDDALNIMSYQGIIYPWMICGNLIFSNNTITSFTPKATFQAIDRNDSSWLSGLSMPSNKYINLTLGASNSTYAAPANGYFSIMIKIGASQGFLLIRNESNILAFQASEIAGQYVGFVMPAKQRDKVLIGYNNRESTAIFRFIYAEGEQ